MEQHTSLGTRMKQSEQEYRHTIPNDHYYIVSLDGKNFSKYTKPFKKYQLFCFPFISAMVTTTNDILNKFGARTGYTHSDEITLIFPKCEENQTHYCNGRIQKICSLMASYCSVRFNLNMFHEINEYNKDYDNKIYVDNPDAIFDARILSFSEDKSYEILNHMIWRSVHDCERNAISGYAQHYFSHKTLNNKNGTDMIKMLKGKGIDWEKDIPLYIKHGVYSKKIQYETTIFVEFMQSEQLVIRNKIENKCFKIYNDDQILLCLLAKYWIDIEHEKF